MRYKIALLSLVAIAVMASFKLAATLSVSSSAFTDGGSIPTLYTCEGRQISPPLKVGNIPAGTVSLALICHDPDAGKNGFTHWVVWNIDTNGNIPEDFKGAIQGLNGTNKPGYKGMCPPTGTHHYHFMVYALDTKLNIGQNTGKAGLEQAMQGHILGQGDLVGLYAKVNK